MDTAYSSGEVLDFCLFAGWLVYMVLLVFERVGTGTLEKVVGALFDNMRESEKQKDKKKTYLRLWQKDQNTEHKITKRNARPCASSDFILGEIL